MFPPDTPSRSPWLAADTDERAHEEQLAIYRRMGGAERITAAFRLTDLARRMARAGIRKRHPDYSPRQVTRALGRLVLGEELSREAWPHEELPDP